jgi:hypothetical protein
LQIDQALALMGSLQTRGGDEVSAEVNRKAYHVTLSGVTRYGLNLATQAALRGDHGSKFYPNPAELRGLYDAAMQPVHMQQKREGIRERFAQETRKIASGMAMVDAQRTEESKARVAQMFADFKAQLPKKDPVTFDWPSVHRRFDAEARGYLEKLCSSERTE